jgi:UPF0716 protein FxsA
MPLPLLLIVFVTVPVGAVPTILILAADSVLGAVLLRRQGRSVWRRFTETMASGQVPHRELQDGVAVIFGGAFLITPGFITDVVGLLLLVPPTREAIRRIVVRRISRRVSRRPVREPRIDP